MKIKNLDCLTYFFISCLFLIFLPMHPYVDDNTRFSYGYIGLISQGRLVPEILYRIIGNGNFTPDVYSVNLFICIALSFSLLLIKYIENNKLILIAFFLNPFMLECLSYHVDILNMILAYVLSIHAAFYENKNIRKMILISSGLSILAALSYQASFNSYAISILASLFLDYKFNKEQLRKNITSRLIVLVAYLPFIKLISMLCEWFYKILGRSEGDYINTRTSLDFTIVESNFYKLHDLLSNSFTKSQLVLFFLLILFSSLVVIYSLRKEKIFSVILLLAPLQIIIITIFPYIFVNADNIIVPRVMYGFSGFFIISYLICYYHGGFKKSANILILSSAFIYLFLAAAYVSYYNKNYEAEINLAREINIKITSKSSDKKPYVAFCGHEKINNGYIKNSMERFPIFKFLIHPFISEQSWKFGSDSFLNINDIGLIVEDCNDEQAQNGKNLYYNPSYNIIENGNDRYIIQFK